MRSFLRFEVRRALSNPVNLVFLAGFPVLLYLLWTKVLDLASGPVSMVSMATYGAMGGALFIGGAIALERSSGWLRQLAVTPLPAHGYIVSKLAGGMLAVLPSVVIVLAAGALLGGVRLPAATWLALPLLIWAGVVPFAALGVAFGYSLKGQSATIAMMVAYFVLAVLGGLWLPVSRMPGGLRTLAEYSPAYQAGSLGWRALDGLAPTGTSVLVLAAWAALFVLLGGWRYRSAAWR
ncbi:ABC transporter permease [Herbidospora sp. NEAU-GS84]|uniref:ABC transporter permease n=1 Tax=Herbidospora solisilvae TaxID=2696284 RepID=A0A7C9J989_9ACTN|nr:ABC transporter permease [Herbidospora solisilvae]NAS20264.1 ABC transporter permease [Herbidospora solisilvae]